MSDRVGVAIVGGGLAGLFLAAELDRRGHADWRLYERGERLGGVVTTIEEDGYRVEAAAGALMRPDPYIDPILDHLGVEPVPADPRADRRYLYVDGRLVAVPGPGIVTTVASPMGLARAAAEPFLPATSVDGDPSLLDLLVARLGREVGTVAATAMAAGVFAGDPALLSARAAFPRLVELLERHGSLVRGAVAMRRASSVAPRRRLHVVAGGMSALVRAAAERFADRLETGTPVTGVERVEDGWRLVGPEVVAERVVLAVPPDAAAAVLGGAAAEPLRELRAEPVVVVALGGRAADVPVPPGFGFLVGHLDDLRCAGMLFESNLDPARAPTGHRLVRAIYGGTKDPGARLLDDDALVALAVEELSAAIGYPVEPSFVRVVRHVPGIPRYAVGHLDRLAAAEQAVADLGPGIELIGWGYRNVGVAGRAQEAVALASRLTAA